jgi:hypothetical protein
MGDDCDSVQFGVSDSYSIFVMQQCTYHVCKRYDSNGQILPVFTCSVWLNHQSQSTSFDRLPTCTIKERVAFEVLRGCLVFRV